MFPLSRHPSVEATRARHVGPLIAFSTFAPAFACASECCSQVGTIGWYDASYQIG